MCIINSYEYASYFKHLIMRINHEQRHPCIVVYASLGKYHGNCIMSYASFHLLREHPIIVLHQQYNHTSHGCIIIFVGASLSWLSSIYTLSWSIVSLFLGMVALHWHKQA